MARSRTPAHRDSAHSSSSATGHEPAQAHERPTADKRRPSTDGLAERMQDHAPVSFSTGRVLALLADPLERLLIDERLSASGEFDVEVAPELRSAVDMASRHFDVAVVDLKCLTIETPTAVRLFVEAIDDTPVVVLGD